MTRADLDFRSIPRMALVNAERFGDELAVLDGGAALTFADVAAQMVSVARSLAASGVEPGDRVALWAPNSAEWVTAALGILATGARLVPVNTRFKGLEAAYVLRTTAARALLCAKGFLGFDYVAMLHDADPELPALKDVTFVGRDCTDEWDAFIDRGRHVAEQAVRDRIEAIRPEDVSDIMFTSGTTGRPKGVVLRHGASLRCYEEFARSFLVERGDRLMVITPFFHCFGYKAGWMTALLRGATCVPVAVFDAGDALRMIEELRVTHTGGPPTLFWALLDHPTRPERDLSSLKAALASAAYVPPELVHRIETELGAHPVAGYGLTEAHAMVATSRPDDPAELAIAWSGKPIAGTEVRVVDDAGVDVAPGERGELLVRGFQLMDGYYDDPEATAAVIDADGWLHTGDLAFANADGYIKVCDRKKDMFIVGGFNVSPAEVEGLLLEDRRLAAAAVVAVPDDHWGEVGVAFVVPAAAGLTPGDVMAWAREHMANYKVPREVRLVDALPVNATGKVLKNELRGLLTAPSSG
ncbi:MAG TPA: AMP-binding protein [Acidimicrobiales bacterium]|nr:AMP-binding protein [Acidimicrobiales bacterium]